MYTYTYVYICIYVYVYIYIYIYVHIGQDSSKGGAVETGCSGLHHIIGCFII